MNQMTSNFVGVHCYGLLLQPLQGEQYGAGGDNDFG